MNPLPDLFITGTDTGVGKTVVSLLIMQYLFDKGRRPFYLKPFQTGCDSPDDTSSDAKFIYEHTAALKGRDPGRSVIYCHRSPKAPYIAAERAQEWINIDRVQKRVAELRQAFNPLVIEGSGGLMVPVTSGKMVVDVIKELECRPLLVARAGLGTINHTLLSLEALRRRKVEPLGIVLADTGLTPEKNELLHENIDAIQQFGGVPVAGVIGRLANFRQPPDSFSKIIERLLKDY